MNLIVCHKNNKCPSVEWNVLIDDDNNNIRLECAACGNVKMYRLDKKKEKEK